MTNGNIGEKVVTTLYLNLLDLPENNTFEQNVSKDKEDTFIRDCRIEREQSQIEAYRREHGHGW